MEELFYRNGDGRIIRIHLHDICHHVPPFLGDWVYMGRVLAVGILTALLVSKEQIGLLVPEDTVIAHALILDHLFQLWPNGCMTLGIFFLTPLLEVHFKCKSLHIRSIFSFVY